MTGVHRNLYKCLIPSFLFLSVFEYGFQLGKHVNPFKSRLQLWNHILYILGQEALKLDALGCWNEVVLAAYYYEYVAGYVKPNQTKTSTYEYSRSEARVILDLWYARNKHQTHTHYDDAIVTSSRSS